MSYTTTRASSLVDRVTLASDSTQVIPSTDPNLASLKDRCYECGGAVTTMWGYSDDYTRTPLVKQYYIECAQCGLTTTYEPGTNAQNEPFAVGRSQARCDAAWKAWFKYHMNQIITAGQYPRWIGNLQAQTS